ncbi:MAG: PspC domain-containing protein [Bacteroidaceae bacterium]|jgi:phage shock protein PspC (stress-responsive transcriptional regulator)|nr:PspC domain-containing protein [Bacteroidaceae bacterium]
MNKRLTRSNDQLIGGVCSGIAEYFELDPSIIRIAYAALTLFTAGFPGILLYIIMLFVMPKKL